LPPHNSAEDQHATETYFGVPWVRVDDAGSQSSQPSAPAEFPEGTYRNEMSIESLLDAKIDESTAHNHAGLWTLTFEDGVFSDGSCAGTYSVSGDRVTATLGDGPDCGSAAGEVLFSAGWQLSGDSLMFTDVRSGHGSERLIETLFGSEPFTRVE
jgi:hypothetical protein